MFGRRFIPVSCNSFILIIVANSLASRNKQTHVKRYPNIRMLVDMIMSNNFVFTFWFKNTSCCSCISRHISCDRINELYRSRRWIGYAVQAHTVACSALRSSTGSPGLPKRPWLPTTAAITIGPIQISECIFKILPTARTCKHLA